MPKHILPQSRAALPDPAQTSNSPETRAQLVELALRYDLLTDHVEKQAKQCSGGGRPSN
jgi:predicted ATP-grasp superfamily ATP-dependent carboligase